MVIKNCVAILVLVAIAIGGCNCINNGKGNNKDGLRGQIGGEMLSEMTISGKRRIIIQVQKCSEGLEYMLGRQQAVSAPKDFDAKPGQTLVVEILVEGENIITKSIEIEPYKFKQREIKITGRMDGPYSGVKESGTLVIRSQKDLEQMWEKITVMSVPRPEPPKIDFNTDIILAAFMGTRMTGGHMIVIEKVIEKENEVVVIITERSPPSGAMVEQVVTRPFYLAIIPKTDKTIKFTRQ